jgi:ATP-binding cassette, subfamily B, bacterial
MAIMTAVASKLYRVEPRSVVPGRQRWDIAVLLNRPRVAELLETMLRERSGIEVVRANPVTGRLLVFHDTALSGDEVGQLVREAAAQVSLQTPVIPIRRSSRPAPSAAPTTARRSGRGLVTLAVVGGGVVALALRSPMLRLGAVLGATAIVIWRGWRRSRQVQLALAGHESTVGAIRQILGPHYREFAWASVLSVLAQVLYSVPLLFMGWMLAVLTKGPTASLMRLSLTNGASQLWFLAGTILVVLAAFAAVSFAASMMWRDLAQTMQHEWRSEMYVHVQRGTLRYLEGERMTRLAEVLTGDIDQLSRFFAGPINTLLQIATCFVVVVGAFLFWAPQIAWIALVPAPIIVWLSFSYQERVAPEHAASSQIRSLLNSQLINNLEASATVKSFSAEDYEIARITRLSEACRQSNHQSDTRTQIYNHAVQVGAFSSLLGVLLFGGLKVLSGTLALEAYNGLIALPTLLLMKLPELGDAVEQYLRTVAALGQVLELRRLPVESGNTGRRLDLATVNGEIVFDGVTFAYPGRSPILRDLSLRMVARQTTGIVGVTGAGKTTIAKLVLRLQDVDSGRVLLDGVDVRDLRLQDLRTAISFVAQDAFLFDGSIGDNIRYGSFDADLERVRRAARLAEAADFVEGLPSQYDTMIGERGVTLSGGQKQRLSLARAIVKNAPILILDEATSAVDNETEAAIQHALADFAQDRTLLIIAHRLSTIRHADWIYVMGEGGMVVEEGTHQELLERDGVYASLWRLQIGDAMT